MRKNVKRMLAVFLAVIMICGGFVMAPMNTMAATTYTVTNEAELKEALANAKDGDVINVGRRFDPTIGPITIKPGTKLYYIYQFSEDDLTLHQITSATALKISVAHMQFATLLGGGGFSEIKEYNITLDSRSGKVNFQNGSTLLYQDSSVKIYLQKSGDRTYSGYEWICTMVNTGTQDLMLGSANTVTLNGQSYSTDYVGCPIFVPYDIHCPAGQVTAFSVSFGNDTPETLNLIFTPQFYDPAGEHLLYEGTPIELNSN